VFCVKYIKAEGTVNYMKITSVDVIEQFFQSKHNTYVVD